MRVVIHQPAHRMKVYPTVLNEPRDTSSTYFPAFDFLRIILALGVFVSHSHVASEIGNACVQIFFSLSGFLIGGILLDLAPHELPRFYFNRSTRIWIPYFIAILLLLAVTSLKQTLLDAKIWEFIFYKVTFVYNWFGPPQLLTSMSHMPLAGTGNHFWSICVEEQFYLFAPFLLVCIPRWAATCVLLALVGLNFVVPHDFAAIALGVLAAMNRHYYGNWHLTKPGLLLVSGATLSAIAAMSLGLVPYTQIFPFIAVGIVALLSFEGRPFALGKVFGGMSFSFYLNHWIGLFAAHSLQRITSSSTAWTLGLCTALLVSLVHYFVVDIRIARGRSVFFRRSRGIFCCALGFTLVFAGATVGLVLRLHFS